MLMNDTIRKSLVQLNQDLMEMQLIKEFANFINIIIISIIIFRKIDYQPEKMIEFFFVFWELLSFNDCYYILKIIKSCSF